MTSLERLANRRGRLAYARFQPKTQVLGGGSGGTTSFVETVANLAAIPTANAGGFIFTLGLNAVGDGQAAAYYWDPTGTDPHNPPMFVRPNDYTSGGGWRQW